MRIRFLAVCVGLVLVVGLLTCAQPAIAQGTGAVAPRITQAVDENNLVTLRGTVHPLARAQYDRGAVADSQPIRRALLLLQRSPAQETALRQLLDGQQSKSSSSYHQWLTPAQFGQQFGPADADVQTVTSWLTEHGFQVNRVSAGRTVIEFSGNAGQVRSAFHTEIHEYVVNGEQHLANASPVQIPAALAPVVAGPVSLHNFPKKAQSHVRGVFTRNSATGEVKPLFTPLSGAFHAVAPGDFNIIYNLPAALSGAGQTIAIVGDSEICTASSPEFSIAANQGGCGSVDDVAQFRGLFGLSTSNLPNVILDGPDPFINEDETEGDLDTEWSGAVAPGATIDFVIAENTEASAGIDLAAEHIIDNNLAPVMSESFGDCEANLGGSNGFYSELWEQAAAQGITVIISAGDSGSATCDDENTEALAVGGIAVNGIASTPFNVAAGGTDFDFKAPGYPSLYWNATNNQTSPNLQSSAKSYIPETTWNDSCAQFATSLTACASASTGSLNIVSGGGGPSTCGVTTASGICVSGYAKPSWQSGVTGIPADGVRDLPDISLFASDGFVSNSFYIICEADAQNGQPCATTGISGFLGVGGTSSAAPTFAGIMTLLNQRMTSSSLNARQGNADYVLYPLAAGQSGLSCNSSTTPASGCVFNDVTKGNNAVPCVGSTANCSAASSSAVGILASGPSPAWNAGAGYDLATGLGTINVTNLISGWAAAEGAFTATTTTLCIVSGNTSGPSCSPLPTTLTINHGQPVSGSISVVPNPGASVPTKPEDVALIGTFANNSTAGVDRFDPNTGNGDIYPLNSSGQLSGFFTSELVGGTYSVRAHYAGDGTLGASDSNAVSVTVNPEGSTATVAVGTVELLNNGNITQGATVPYGDFNLIRVDVTGSSSGFETGTGSVTLTDKGGAVVGPTGAAVSSLTLNSEGYLEDQTAYLAVGSHSFVAKYNGDASYSASLNSAAVSLTVTQASTVMTLTSTATTVHAGAPVMITAFVDTETTGNPSGGSSGAALAGTVTFTTPAKSAVFRPALPPSSPSWLTASLCASLGLLLLLFVRFPARRRWGVVFTTMLLAAAIGTSVSCGGGGSSEGGGVGGGATTIGSVGPAFVLDSNQFVAAQASITFTPTATETITATYSGDANYRGSTSTPVTITVQ